MLVGGGLLPVNIITDDIILSVANVLRSTLREQVKKPACGIETDF